MALQRITLLFTGDIDVLVSFGTGLSISVRATDARHGMAAFGGVGTWKVNTIH